MLSRADLMAGEQREVLEAYRMFAHDMGWLRRIREAIETGLSAEAAVRRVQEENRLRIGHASDPYLRERLIDLEDLADRLLRHLVGKAATHDPSALPPEVILVARNLSAADLLEYDRARLRGVVLEEGSRTAHVTIVARAFDVPMLGRVDGIMDFVDAGEASWRWTPTTATSSSARATRCSRPSRWRSRPATSGGAASRPCASCRP